MADADPKTIHLSDYRPFSHLVQGVTLTFRLHPEATRVLAAITLAPNPASAPDQDLRLDGEGLRLIACRIDGIAVTPAVDAVSLTIAASALPSG
ncbi:MAG: aminopeptidase N, partial [Pseudomonadota bacterium]